MTPPHLTPPLQAAFRLKVTHHVVGINLKPMHTSGVEAKGVDVGDVNETLQLESTDRVPQYQPGVWLGASPEISPR